jgi:polyhydroxybutyrate depolymerase
MRHVLLALILLAACADPLPPVPDGGLFAPRCFRPPEGGVFTTGLSAPVPGCALPPDAGVFSIQSLGLTQSGAIVVPPAAPGTPLPVVLVFHPAYSTGSAARETFGLEGPADGGAIFVYPQARQGTWDITQDSLDGSALDRLLRKLWENYCIDPNRIYIAGFSAGAVYTLWLGCNVPGTFRGMAAIAGTDDRFDRRCCTGTISGMFIHGTADEAIPYGTGVYSRNDLLSRDGCTGTATPMGPYCQKYGCPVPLAVEFCPWSGGHEAPVWAGGEIWRFFDALR